MSYKEPERMKFYILNLFDGTVPSVSMPHASASDRKYWARHWWERETSYGRFGDRGYIMDVYPNGQVLLKDIRQCYLENNWETNV